MKTPTQWSGNPSADANERVYDSAYVVYDSAVLTYDGIVSGDQADTEKVPTAWGEL